MGRPLRLGVLVSGSGSNLQAILDACAARRIPAEVAVVICNVPDARALQRARDARVPTVTLPHGEHARREDYDVRLVAELRARAVELVCLAGFMRIVTPVLLSAFPQRVINIHPSLLPAFPGMHGVRQAFRAGVRVSGCTVHFVDEGTDSGPIVIQAAVPVLDGDTEESLAARILVQEHRIYPRAIQLIAEGRVQIDGRRVRIAGTRPDGTDTIASPPVEDP
ncbi:MAG TPA: phosphoribosylglycinamide formyltransferase [Myxococcales bacterium]|nr:phosphoribosylglycinamide formyltransferase [Myxococcales bacterium]